MYVIKLKIELLSDSESLTDKRMQQLVKNSNATGAEHYNFARITIYLYQLLIYRTHNCNYLEETKTGQE